MIHIDLNADLGEGLENDALLMPYLSSCSIACGGHAGDAYSIKKALRLAKMHNVKVGAHPSFPDKDNFGRKIMTMTKSSLTDTIYEQLMRFIEICEIEEMTINHVKPHGALYNLAAKDAPTADAIVDAILLTKTRPKLYVPPNSILAEKARNLLPLVFEAFVDRQYHDDLSLVARNVDGAVITSSEKAWQQLKTLAINHEINTVEGNSKTLKAETFCLHGDNPNALKILQFVTDQLPRHQIAKA